MSLRVSPLQLKRFQAALALEVASVKRRKEAPNHQASDIVSWAESNFWIPPNDSVGWDQPHLIKLAMHQKCVYRLFFTRNKIGRFPFRTAIYSSIKQSGKSVSGAVVARWMAETQSSFASIYTVGNDLKQAQERAFAEIYKSLQLAPNWNPRSGTLPGRWHTQATSMECLVTGTKIKAIAVDAKGEAGGKPMLSVFTELWGMTETEATRFWEELSPVPTIPDSMRMVETYAGFEGESMLLYGLYEQGLKGRQLTAHDLAIAGASDRPGESYEELLWAFHETGGDPNAPVPVWVDEDAGMGMYWDSGIEARRMPWQHEYAGESAICDICREPQDKHKYPGEADSYYRDMESSQPLNAFRRQHFNEWVNAESSFVDIANWDVLREDLPPFEPGDPTPCVMGVDAGTSHDCFAVVLVTRHPTRHNDVAVRRVRIWNPKESGRVSYEEADNFVRLICQGGCRYGHAKSRPVEGCGFCESKNYEIPSYKVECLVYDAYQLELMSQQWRRDSLVWAKPFPQTGLRLTADRALYDAIIGRQIVHDGDPNLRQHILNANAKLQKEDDSKLRITQKSKRPIDALVALSMSNHQCRALLLPEVKRGGVSSPS